MNRPGMSGDSSSWKGWGHGRRLRSQIRESPDSPGRFKLHEPITNTTSHSPTIDCSARCLFVVA
ncbi:hypothetical protein DDF83_18415 [Mycobacterium tuberculosis]|nr:hypothetical protein DDF83_18415 [Mycobacterium tuberculosis]